MCTGKYFCARDVGERLFIDRPSARTTSTVLIVFRVRFDPCTAKKGYDGRHTSRAV